MATITLTIPNELLPVYQRFQVENGATWADAYLIEKLKELEIRFWEIDAKVEWEKTHPDPKKKVI